MVVAESNTPHFSQNSIMIALQYILPKKLLTQLAGAFARSRSGPLTQFAIRKFIAKYGVNMTEAASADPASYYSFNDFFTRALKAGARPLANTDFVCPVDGAISQFGAIEFDQIFQAKGHNYSTQALVGGDATLAKRFENGHFATIYLSPKDYHRIHMPCDATLTRMIYVPGDLFSVNPATAQAVPGLFARNERVVCVFDTPHGPFVNVLVGATIVGSTATVWHGVVNPPRSAEIREWMYKPGEVVLKKGDEMARFLLGSTVVMLWPKDTLAFNETWSPARGVRMGEAMATLTK
jgi:phosphatidylserine decarboxylase